MNVGCEAEKLDNSKTNEIEYENQRQCADDQNDEIQRKVIDGPTEIADTKQEAAPVAEKTTEEVQQADMPSSPCAIEEEIQALLENVPEISNHFTILDKIGEGAFSSVFLACLKHYPEVSERFALKHILPTTHPARIENELRCLLKLGGQDNVMGVKLCFRNKDHVVIVMDHFPHEKFQDVITVMSPEEARDYMKNLLIALRRIHQYKVIHRDVKPSNFLYNREKKLQLSKICGCTSRNRLQAEFVITSSSTYYSKSNEPCWLEKSDQTSPPVLENQAAASRSLHFSCHPSEDFSRSLTIEAQYSLVDFGLASGKFLIDRDGEKFGRLSCAPPSTSSTRVPLSPSKANIDQSNKVSPSFSKPSGSIPLPSLPKKPPAFAVPSCSSKVFLERSGLCDCLGKPQICSLCVARKNQMAPRAGTAGFRALEVLLKSPSQDTAIDIWSAGTIFLSVLSARYPFFRAQDDMGYLAQIISLLGSTACINAASSFGKVLTLSESMPATDLHGTCRTLRATQMASSCLGTSCTHQEHLTLVQLWTAISQKPFDLLTRMLDPNPYTRITAEEALKHPYFTEAGPS
ncbi:cell division cycle 7-related protein kinase [Elysia marginata]|uniref:non-specific serine/threonine protein kinase n=1 Tax=Elysia marginata TaxID=1093978 RepID=A0AAV4GLJ8_9GAST|nr:cell division cycle 7-related protein kinase [Elysia marginata]